MYYDSFSQNANKVIDIATNLAKRYGCRYIGSEHILYGLIVAPDGRAGSILREARVDSERYLEYFKKTIEPDIVIPGNMFTPRTKRLFEKAVDISLRAHAGFVGTEHLLLALLLDERSTAVAILKMMRVNVDDMAEGIAESFEDKFPDDAEPEEDVLGKSFAFAGKEQAKNLDKREDKRPNTIHTHRH